MAADVDARTVSGALFQYAPGLLMAPLPLPLLQPLLRHIAYALVRKRPELFARLGPHQRTRFLIDPTNLPFVLMLQPDRERPVLKALRRWCDVEGDARIAGTVLTLLGMVDGRLDGDALFFTRELIVEGDTEAVVSLRNALDDLERSIADDVAVLFGPAGRIALAAMRQIRRPRHVPVPD